MLHLPNRILYERNKMKQVNHSPWLWSILFTCQTFQKEMIEWGKTSFSNIWWSIFFKGRKHCQIFQCLVLLQLLVLVMAKQLMANCQWQMRMMEGVPTHQYFTQPLHLWHALWKETKRQTTKTHWQVRKKSNLTKPQRHNLELLRSNK